MYFTLFKRSENFVNLLYNLFTYCKCKSYYVALYDG